MIKLIALVTKGSRKLEQRQQEMKWNKLRVNDSQLSEISDDEAAFVQKRKSLLATLQCTAPPKFKLEFNPTIQHNPFCGGMFCPNLKVSKTKIQSSNSEVFTKNKKTHTHKVIQVNSVYNAQNNQQPTEEQGHSMGSELRN